jgi:outer membrane immunogenic protein
MKKLLLIVGIAATSFCAVPANAQGQMSTWTGYYAGVQGGYAIRGMAGVDFDRDTDTNISGWVGGVQVGGNWQNGNAVFGVNINYNASHIHGSKDLGGELYSGTVKSFGTAEARLGVLISPATQLFASGGMAFGSATGQVQTGADTFKDTRLMTGWTGGGGVQWAVNPTTSWQIQYKFVNLGSSTFTLDAPESVHFKFSLVTIGATWKY